MCTFFGKRLFLAAFDDDLSVNVAIFGGSVEARAKRRNVITMAMNPATIHARERRQELKQGRFLVVGSGVTNCSGIIQTADIANANTVRVVHLAMRSGLANCAPVFDRAIKPDEVMISNRPQASLLIPRPHEAAVNVHARRRRCAMYYDVVYIAHRPAETPRAGGSDVLYALRLTWAL